MSNVKNSSTPTAVTVVAEYELWGDITTERFWDDFVHEGASTGLILDATFLHEGTSAFGLRHLFFTVDMYVPPLTPKTVRKYIRKQINKALLDTDVKILNITVR